MDVKTTFRMLALRYHPDKNDPEITGMNQIKPCSFATTSEHGELMSEITDLTHLCPFDSVTLK